jgi:hypothetical protein
MFAERWWTGFAIIAFAAVSTAFTVLLPADEVVLTIGEPYDQVRLQSRSTLPIRDPDGFWGGFVKRPARLRFSDPRFGFITPVAKFFFVSVDRRYKVNSVKLSPQVETLPLEEALSIVLDLQRRFRQHGWAPFRSAGQRAIEDTPAMRAEIRRCMAPTAYWQAEDKYQLTVNIRCFRSDARPNDERYLVTLQLGAPTLKDYGDDDPASTRQTAPFEPSCPPQRSGTV